MGKYKVSYIREGICAGKHEFEGTAKYTLMASRSLKKQSFKNVKRIKV